MKFLVVSIFAVLLFKVSFAQEKKLPELIIDKYSISKKTPENARDKEAKTQVAQIILISKN